MDTTSPCPTVDLYGANPCPYSIPLLLNLRDAPAHVIKKKRRRQKMPKSFWKSIASGIGPRGGSYELDRCNLQLQLIQNPPIHHSLFPRSPSSSSQSQSLSLSLSRSLSLMAIATESPQQEKVIQLGKKMLLSCVIRVLICIRWVGFLCFSDLNSLYPFAWFAKINGFSLFL